MLTFSLGKNILETKGYEPESGVSELIRAYAAGIPLLPGFVIAPDSQDDFLYTPDLSEETWQIILGLLREVERDLRRKFDDPTNPLMLEIIPCPSYPDRLYSSSIKYIGLTEATLAYMTRYLGNETDAVQLYRQFVETFCNLVGGIDNGFLEHILQQEVKNAGARGDTDLTNEQIKKIVDRYKSIFLEQKKQHFPDSVYYQLRYVIGTMLSKWNSSVKKTNEYSGKTTGVLVRAMALPQGPNAGWGLCYSRNPFTGKREFFGEFKRKTDNRIIALTKFVETTNFFNDRLHQIVSAVESHIGEAQQIQFVVDDNRVWVCEFRPFSKTSSAAVNTLVDMVDEGILTEEQAIKKAKIDDFRRLLLPHFDEKYRPGSPVAQGIGLGPGVASGKAVFDIATAENWVHNKEPIILVMSEIGPEEIHGLMGAKGVLVQRGGATSHAAIVARGLGIPYVLGTDRLRVDHEKQELHVGNGTIVRQGDDISLDGRTGEVFLGKIPTLSPSIINDPNASRLLGWTDSARRLEVYANADSPAEASLARELGAKGIGLCRIEHMLLRPDRISKVQQAICYAYAAGPSLKSLREAETDLLKWPGSVGASNAVIDARRATEGSPYTKPYRTVLEDLEAILRNDLSGMFSAMDGLPVTIRLIDPPLHEFLPSRQALLNSHDEQEFINQSPVDRETLLQIVKSLEEINPMLGLRGVRLVVLFPEIARMQVRAILLAASEAQQKGAKVFPQVMIPLVGHIDELLLTKNLISEAARSVFAEIGHEIDFEIGTMIELPRATMMAEELAKQVDFFSFGTNDLTQLVFGYSRDDAQTHFLTDYLDEEILPSDPFQEIDQSGVGALIKVAVDRGRVGNPGLEIGVCGEHGGDPASIEFFNSLDIDYVSCTPLRIPIARLAAAKAKLFMADGKHTK